MLLGGGPGKVMHYDLDRISENLNDALESGQGHHPAK